MRATATRQALLDVGARTTALREWIVAEEAQNGCRRVLRDLDTVQGHLSHVLLAALNIPAPRLGAPMTIAAGDAVPVSFTIGDTGGLPVRTSIEVQGNASLARDGERQVLRVPADAAPGELITLVGQALLGPEGQAAPIRVTQTVTVVEPLTIELRSEGTDPGTGAFRVGLLVRNNSSTPREVRLALVAPPGWPVPDAQTLRLGPGAEERSRVLLTPGAEAEAGSVEIAAIATQELTRTARNHALHSAGADLGQPGLRGRVDGLEWQRQLRHRHRGRARGGVVAAEQRERAEHSGLADHHPQPPGAPADPGARRSRARDISGVADHDYRSTWTST